MPERGQLCRPGRRARVPVPPRLRRPRVREAAQCQLCGSGHLLAVHGPAELAPGQHHTAGACPGCPVTEGSRAGQSSEGPPCLGERGGARVNQNSLDVGPADVERLLGHKSHLWSGKEGGVEVVSGDWILSRHLSHLPPRASLPCCTHSRAWGTAGAGSGLQLWPRILSLLAPGPLFIHLTSGISSLNSGRGGQKARPT